MGTQIAYGNVAGIIDLPGIRTPASVNTQTIISTKSVTGISTNTATRFANTVAIANFTSSNITTNLYREQGGFFSNSYQVSNKFNYLIGYLTANSSGIASGAGVLYATKANSTTNAISTVITTSTVLQQANLSQDTPWSYLGNAYSVSNKLNYSIGYLNFTHTNANPGSGGTLTGTLFASTDFYTKGNLHVGGQYFLSNGISWVSHTGGFTNLAGSGGGGGGGLTGKIETWT
jgi:hypothetical protein